MVSEYKKSAFWKTQNQMVGWGSLGRSSLLRHALKTYSLPVRSGNSISKCLAQEFMTCDLALDLPQHLGCVNCTSPGLG